MVKNFIYTLSFLFFSVIHLNGQDPVFSQYYASPVLLNPAFAGNSYAPHLVFQYRYQWPSFVSGGALYETYSAAFDQYFEPINSGVGLTLLSDRAGDGVLNTTRISGLYAYRLQVNRELFVKFGVEASYVQSTLDWDKLIFFDQIDPEIGPISPGGTPFPTNEIPPDDTNKGYFDLGAGLLLYSSNLYGGITVKHMNTPNESFYDVNENLNNGLPLRLTLHAGGQIDFNTRNNRRTAAFISPNILFVRQGEFGQVNVGAYAGIGLVYGGLWFRHAFGNPDSGIILVGVKKGKLKIGYSFDLTISDLAGKTGGSHELSVSINFEQPRPIDYNDCFEMFR